MIGKGIGIGTLGGLRFAAQDSIGFPDVAPPRETPIGVARRLAREELARTEALVRQRGAPFTGANDIYDAERHARWSYRMAQELGPGVAHHISTSYEMKGLLYDRQPVRNSRMDLHNNAIGITAYRNRRPIPDIGTPGLMYMEENFPRPGKHTYVEQGGRR